MGLKRPGASHVCVLESASGIKEHDAIGQIEDSCGEQM